MDAIDHAAIAYTAFASQLSAHALFYVPGSLVALHWEAHRHVDGADQKDDRGGHSLQTPEGAGLFPVGRRFAVKLRARRLAGPSMIL
jgi:hypothetical protein